MAQVPQIPSYSDEFGLVQYIMQIQLGCPKFKIAELYEIGEKKQISGFNNFVSRLANTNIIDAFIDVRTLEQPVSDIIHRGIKIHAKNGLKVRVGSIKLTPGLESYQYVHCIVALGKVINFQDKNAEVLDNSFVTGEVPKEYIEGFNSVRLNEEGDFLIYNQEQIKSVHLVRFVGGHNTEPCAQPVHICSNCGCENATLWCEQDQVKLCAECDAKLHSGNKLLMSHVRVPISEAKSFMSPCPHHPGNIMQYYCEKCHMPVCKECKINGNHSKGQCIHHKLIPIDQAYKNAINSLKKPTRAEAVRRNRLEAELKNADEKLNTLLENTKSVELEIDRIVNIAKMQLRQLAAVKATKLKSAKMEIERKLNDLDRMEENIRYHKDNSDAVDFLEAFVRRNELEEEVMSNTDLQTTPSGKEQFAVFGKLEVSKLDQNNDETESQFSDTNADMETQRTNESTVSRSVTETDEDLSTAESIYIKPVEKTPHFTKLTKIAQHKEQKNEARGLSLNFKPFAESRLLSDDEERRKLYMCLPFKEQPETHLMFSTYNDGRSISKMHKLIDGRGITVILASANSQVFGGFAAAKWVSNGVPFGKGSSSFLFSITKDAFIPNKGQLPGDGCLLAERDTLSFGEIDLSFTNNFDECHSELENSYGIGFLYGGDLAKQFLAGERDFYADDVEVWGFFAP